MSLLELYEFSGKAVVDGVVRDVVFSQNNLTIRGLHMVEANRILKLLEANGLHAVSLPQPPALVPQGSGAPAPAVASVGAAGSPPQAGATAAASIPPSAPPPTEPKQDDLPGSLGQAGAGPAPTDNVVPFNPGKAGNGTLDPSRYAGLKRMRDVLKQLMEDGYKTVPEMSKACIQLKPSIAFLSRVDDSDMERRVTGALAATEKAGA